MRVELIIQSIWFFLKIKTIVAIHQSTMTAGKIELMQLICIIPRHAGQGGQVKTNAGGG
jgi:hypothetical protein